MRTVARSRTRRLVLRLALAAVLLAAGVLAVVVASHGHQQARIPVIAVVLIAAAGLLLPVAVIDFAGTPGPAQVRRLASAPGVPATVVSVRRRYRSNSPRPAGVVFTCTDPDRPREPPATYVVTEPHGDLRAMASLVGVPGIFAYLREEGEPFVVLCDPRGRVEVHGAVVRT